MAEKTLINQKIVDFSAFSIAQNGIIQVVY